MLPDNLSPALAEALARRGYSDLTAVQVAVTQPEAAGRDLLVSAKTGSGKTVAYGLAIAPDLLTEDGALPTPGAPLALIIAPTRELAIQVQLELTWLYASAGARVVSCVGGMDPRREQRALAAGAHIVVGTPGRLRDHLERGQLETDALCVVVLDEADEMLDLGFREELEALLDAAPKGRRTLLFSATLPKPIIALARQYQQDALRLSVGGGEDGHADIDYRAIVVAPSDVEHAVVNLLRFFDPGAAIVFCSTREAVRRLHVNLMERGFSVVALSGELTQNERTNALQALRDRRARVCVATDVAARGIDIPDLELVIHAELPHDAQSLQHRSGRTGRAGKKGVSAILVPHPRRRKAEGMLRTANIQAHWESAPSAEDIRAKDQARLIEELKPAGEQAEEDLAVARALLADSEAETVVAALVRAQRSALPAAEDLVETTPEPSSFAPRDAGPRPGFEDTVWFTINLGRTRNAEARWLLPLICRCGHVTKKEIGAIRVFDRETRFEIVAAAADRFEAASAKIEEKGAVIERLADPDAPVKRERPRRDKPFERRPFERGQDDAPPRPPRRDGFVNKTMSSAPPTERMKGDSDAGSVQTPWTPHAPPKASPSPLPAEAGRDMTPRAFQTAQKPAFKAKAERKPKFAPAGEGGARPYTSKKQSGKLGSGKPGKFAGKPNKFAGKPKKRP
jgi:ATP-dependent RNA helicase DeaD